jgi:sulfonate transport system permease protein
MKNRFRKFALGAILPAGLLAGWFYITSTGSLSETELPKPTSVYKVIGELLRRHELWWNIGASVQRVFLGYLAGVTIAFILGSLAGLNKTIHATITPILNGIRAVPSLAWVPLLLIWLGIGESPKITLIAIGAFFPVFTTVISGVRNVDRALVEVGRAYGLKRFGIVLKIYLPAAAPQIFSGLRLGLAQSWLFLVAAELIASSRGLGFLLIDSQSSARTDIVIFAIVTLALLGKFTDFLLAQVEKRALAWNFIQ